MGQNRAKVRSFVIFSSLGSLVFLEVAYDYSLKHCLITSRENTHEKKFGGLKLDQKLGFLPFSQGCIISEKK